jgi:ribose 5-phosphate isomerase B
MKIVIGSDHAGYNLKEAIKDFLDKKGISVLDVGTDSDQSCDYPDYATKAVEKFYDEDADLGILICGTGVGMSITANKFKGIRAALVYNEDIAILSRKHNHANFLCLGARFIDTQKALRLVEKWISTEPEAGRHLRRVDKIRSLEERICR